MAYKHPRKVSLHKQACLLDFLMALLIIFVAFPRVSQAGCGDIPTLDEWKNVTRTHKGFYYNCRFHYGVSIPQGFIGRSVESPAPQHGFGIVDSRYPSGIIWVSGDYWTSDKISSNNDLAETHLQWIKKNAQQIVSIQKQSVTLDGLPALRLIVQAQCSDGKLFVHDLVLMLQGGIEYRIKLCVEASNYTEHVRILEQLVSTWQFRGPWCEMFCGDSPPLSSSEEWISSTSSGPIYMNAYSNCYYGYSVLIPEGLSGQSEYPTHVTEGFGILLSHQGYLRVEGGGANRFNWTSLGQVAKAYETWISTASRRVLAIQQKSVTFGELPALRVTAWYECPAGAIMVKDLFFAFRDEHTLYRLELLAEDEKYEEYKPILEQIVNTFQLKEILHGNCKDDNNKP